MKRRHLFEFNDATWLPTFFRALVTDYLRTLMQIVQPFSPQLPLIAQALKRSPKNAGVVDLCSGSGGPWAHLSAQLNRLARREVPILLTDRFPNLHTTDYLQALPGVSLHEKSLDATQVPSDMPGMRTCFNGLHQFEPVEAAAILRGAVKANEPVVIMEMLKRSWLDVLVLLFSPLLVWLLTPFIRPFSWRRLLFTYVLPVAPLLILFDTLASILRCYTPAELEAMARDVAGNHYQWFSGSYRYRAMAVTYLIGYPKNPMPQ